MIRCAPKLIHWTMLLTELSEMIREAPFGMGKTLWKVFLLQGVQAVVECMITGLSLVAW